nr:MAG TPA: hypothetical protein [Caudoviricetes sp.]
MEVQIEDVKQQLREAIKERYGSVANFIKHEDSQKYGGVKLRTYLYDKGNNSLVALAPLCQMFEIGSLSKKVEVVRNVRYYLKTHKSKSKSNKK